MRGWRRSLFARLRRRCGDLYGRYDDSSCSGNTLGIFRIYFELLVPLPQVHLRGTKHDTHEVFPTRRRIPFRLLCSLPSWRLKLCAIVSFQTVW